MEIKQFRDLALAFLALTMMLFLGVLLPVLGNLLLLLLPLPVIIISAKYDSKLAIAFIFLTAVILALLVTPMIFIILIFNVGLIGVSIGAAIKEEFSTKRIFLVGVIATIVSLVLILGLSVYSFEVDILNLLENNIYHNLNEYNFSEIIGDTLSLEELVAEVIIFIKATLPAFFIIVGITITSLNYYVATLFLTDLAKKDNSFLELKSFKLPKRSLILYLLSIILISFAVSKNIFIILSFLLMIEGIALLYYYLEHRMNTTLIILILAMLVFIPFLNQVLLILGLTDVIFDFRKQRENKTGS